MCIEAGDLAIDERRFPRRQARLVSERARSAHAWIVLDGRAIAGVVGYEPVVAFGQHGTPIC